MYHMRFPMYHSYLYWLQMIVDERKYNIFGNQFQALVNILWCVEVWIFCYVIIYCCGRIKYRVFSLLRFPFSSYYLSSTYRKLFSTWKSIKGCTNVINHVMPFVCRFYVHKTCYFKAIHHFIYCPKILSRFSFT